MLSSDSTWGQFTYIGIEKNLRYIIDPNIYNKSEIILSINIDGADLFEKTKNGIWPILGKLYNVKYKSKPFLIAFYYGHSKPESARDFLKMFVAEVNVLIHEGIDIESVHYESNIKAFVCDTPARAFVKRCKGHTGFYSCERCDIKGETVVVSDFLGTRRKIVKKRCFLSVGEERTHDSFLNQTQPLHHVTEELSPLLDIDGFDIIKNVILDSMHLLCLGVSKFLVETFIRQLDARELEILQTYLDTISSDIPIEFQRKKFDLKDVINWKATQYRFILFANKMYSGAAMWQKAKLG